MFYTKVSSNVKRQHLILTTDIKEFSKTTSKKEPQLFIQYSCSWHWYLFKKLLLVF